MMPMRGELAIPAARMGSAMGEQKGWERLVMTVTNPDLLTVTGICVLAIAITLLAMFIWPDAGEIIQSANLY